MQEKIIFNGILETILDNLLCNSNKIMISNYMKGKNFQSISLIPDLKQLSFVRLGWNHFELGMLPE